MEKDVVGRSGAYLGVAPPVPTPRSTRSLSEHNKSGGITEVDVNANTLHPEQGPSPAQKWGDQQGRHSSLLGDLSVHAALRRSVSCSPCKRQWSKDETVFLKPKDGDFFEPSLTSTRGFSFVSKLSTSPGQCSKTSSGIFCRICHDGEGVERLISPCQCAGSMALVHRTCIEKWLSTSNHDTCELCHHKYLISRHPKPFMKWLCEPSVQDDQRNLVGDLICFFLLTPLAAISTYLCASGAAFYLEEKKSESIGLICLCVVLVIIYMVWVLLTIRYHVQVWYVWRENNQEIRLEEFGRQPVSRMKWRENYANVYTKNNNNTMKSIDAEATLRPQGSYLKLDVITSQEAKLSSKEASSSSRSLSEAADRMLEGQQLRCDDQKLIGNSGQHGDHCSKDQRRGSSSCVNCCKYGNSPGLGPHQSGLGNGCSASLQDVNHGNKTKRRPSLGCRVVQVRSAENLGKMAASESRVHLLNDNAFGNHAGGAQPAFGNHTLDLPVADLDLSDFSQNTSLNSESSKAYWNQFVASRVSPNTANVKLGCSSLARHSPCCNLQCASGSYPVAAGSTSGPYHVAAGGTSGPRHVVACGTSGQVQNPNSYLPRHPSVTGVPSEENPASGLEPVTPTYQHQQQYGLPGAPRLTTNGSLKRPRYNKNKVSPAATTPLGYTGGGGYSQHTPGTPGYLHSVAPPVPRCPNNTPTDTPAGAGTPTTGGGGGKSRRNLQKELQRTITQAFKKHKEGGEEGKKSLHSGTAYLASKLKNIERERSPPLSPVITEVKSSNTDLVPVERNDGVIYVEPRQEPRKPKSPGVQEVISTLEGREARPKMSREVARVAKEGSSKELDASVSDPFTTRQAKLAAKLNVKVLRPGPPPDFKAMKRRAEENESNQDMII